LTAFTLCFVTGLKRQFWDAQVQSSSFLFFPGRGFVNWQRYFWRGFSLVFEKHLKRGLLRVKTWCEK
jgi:hypothetical protein